MTPPDVRTAGPRRAAYEDFYPLTPLQKGLLFHTVEGEDAGVYVVQLQCVLAAGLDVEAFRRAWERIVARHAALRTAFLWRGVKEPVQVVHREARPELRVEDWSGLGEAERRAGLARYLEEDRAAGFALERAPLLRLALFRRAGGEWDFVWSTHHAVVDGWCLPLIVQELVALYERYVAGREVELPQPRPYRDFVAWLHRRDGAATERFWRGELGSFEAPTLLEQALPGPEGGERGHGEHWRALGEAETEWVRAAARRGRVTLGTLAQGAWALVLGRYCGAEDVLYGATVSGRPAELAGAEEMVGLFINTLPVRVAVPGEAEAGAWLGELQERLAELRGYEHTPLVEVQGWSGVPRGETLFDTLFVFENYALGDAASVGETALGVREVRTVERTGYAVTVSVLPAGPLAFRYSYDRGRIAPEAVERLAEHVVNVLRALAGNPGVRLGEIGLLSEGERAQVVEGWNATGADYPAGSCVHELFAEQAARTPGAVALVFGAERVTYAELDARADRLAAELRARGVGPDVRVGLCVERSAEMWTGVLAILKAGGAYVPLDPEYPVERLAFMLEDSGARTVVAGEVAGRMEFGEGVEVVRVDGSESPHPAALEPPPSPVPGEGHLRAGPAVQSAQAESVPSLQRLLSPEQEAPTPRPSPASRGGESDSVEGDDRSMDMPLPRNGGGWRARGEPGGGAVHPDNLAYVIYTSGSTGRPKGVAVAHRPLVNLVAWQERSWLRPGPAVTLQFATISFDASFHEAFSCWAEGGTLVVVPEEMRRDPAALLELVEREGVERMFMPAVALQHLAEEAVARGAVPPRLKEVQTAGEQLRVTEPMRRWLAALGAPLHNHYGPSETHVVTAYALSGDPEAWPLLPSIGGPVANSACYVADRHLRPLPQGVPGELYLGGACLARGYLDRPDLTAERFVPDPFSAEAGARMYRSGDRVRWRADGTLEFLGRADSQVKVRGFRVEPGEVAAVVEAHPAVREAVVEVRGEGAERRLVAYLVPVNGAVPAAEIREHVRGRLPEYMVPSAFVTLEALPLTPSGKVNRRALPEPGGAGAAEGHVAPRTPAEELAAGVWAEVLGVERVGVHDSFYDLGGHSLLAMRVASRLREVLGTEVGAGAVLETRTVAALVERVEAARRAGAGGEAPPLVPVPRDRPLPLSFAQQRLWLIHQMDPESPAYNLSFALRARGELDVGALAGALSDLARRHETLRTTLALVDGEPVQVVGEPRPWPVPVADLRRLPADAREAAARRAAAGDAARPFDLARGPVARAGLLRTAEDEWVLLLSLHHVAGDGWSTAVFVRELSAFYDARLRGGEASLPPLPVQYADFAAWQRAWLTGEVLERQLAWWRERLAGAPPVLELPTDRPHAPARSPREAYHPVVLPAATRRAVRELSRREGATPFMTLLAAWQLLLARYSGQDDVSVGTPVAGRTRLETEGLIGFFVNTLVLRTELPDRPGFRALLGRVREGTLGAFAHQEVPFERLVEELAPERSLTHTPLFQVLFSLRSDHAGAVSMGPLRLEPIAAEEGTAVFDLGLELAEAGEELSGAFSYRTDLFDGATVERMGRHYAALLDAVLAEPERSVHEVGFLAAPERERLLTEWGTRPGAAAPFVPVHEAVSRRARSAPEAVSVLFEGATLSYAELEERTERLARVLARRGVGPETRVGVCMERSPGLVAAILAVLRAGGACVPLDPANPAERLAYVLADAGVRLLLADASTVDAVPAYAGETLLVGAGAPDEDAGSVLPDVDPRSAAYVVYTSGSTGRPKGVVVEHAAVASHVAAFAGVLGIGPADRVLHAASAGFDVSMEQILVTLSAGATLVLRGPEPWNPADWPARVRALGITVADLPPAYWQEVIDSGAGEALPDLRVLVVGVDAVPSAAVPRWRGALDTPARLVNGYGPTEAVVTATVYEVPVDYPAGYAGAAVPVGGPLPGRAAYVLDRTGSPVPVGVPGELHLGGFLLARGYLGRPDLTAERFVPDPFGAEPGARLYRTGDRVRWLASGALEFLGRTDAQVKVRGFRVEPGEVEAALLEHPGVREAAVVAREDAPGDRRLVAYLAGGASMAELRAHLKGRLPEYMVPSAFVAMEALPLTPGGKVDRRALPAPERTGEVDAYVAPRTPTEEILTGIYAEVLGVERVGATDDFFALAGHSLLAMRLVSRVREALGTELPLRAVFEAPTVAGLAERVEAGARAVAPPIVPVPRDRPLPLSFAQQRLWFLDQLQPGSAAYNLPAALRLHGRLDAAALRKSLSEVVRRHESLRTVFGGTGEEPVQVIREAAGVALPVTDLRVLPVEAREREILRLAAEEAARPFDLAAGPLLRSSLVRLDEEEWALLFTLHHVVSDGWSMEVLVREVSALYEGSRLPALPVQYADYAVWQRGWLSGEVLEAQLAWWRRRLAGAPPVLELPTDRPRPTVQDGRGARVPFALSTETTHALGELSRRGGATLFMTLLAAWQLLLARHSGQEDVSVGVPVAGRGRVEVEGLIGFFVNTLVLRADLSGYPSFGELLGRVRETALGAFQHQDLPFERLVEELAPERSLSRSPLFQVTFALQNVEPAAPWRSRLRVEPLGGDRETAQFDLALSVEETEAGLRGALSHRMELFDRATAERMLARYTVLLEAVAADPARPVWEVEMLAPAERRQLLAEWSPGASVPVEPPAVHEGVALQAERTPDAPAVAFGEETLTFRELVEGADRLAGRLRGLGVGPDTRVGVCLERSLDLPVALLAVLRSGGAYVPLDPGYPAERLAYMLADARVSVLLTTAALRDRFPGYDGPVLHPDQGEGEGPLRVEVDPDHLAYVIYTSGSTGRPKGVAVPHRALASHLAWMGRAFPLGAQDRVLQKTPVSFDASVWEFWAPLLSGATLVVAPPEVHRDPGALARMVAQERITVLQVVPSLLGALLEEGGREEGGMEEATELRRLFCGGEALPAGMAARARALTGAEVVNLYGPTEVCIQSVTHTYTGSETGVTVPIGRAVDGVRARVLDRAGAPVPAGVAGELHLGGVQLARGYLGRPELTAERFVPDALSGEAGARLYRTGDRVRRLADGTLEFLGRTDEQVKVRGFRIEPGEVEAALREHGGVREAAVVAREDASGERRLVAYVVGEASAAELRAHLKGRLPEHMVPSAFVALDALPLTPSGKTDRRSLPAPERTGDVDAYVAPRTPAEEILAGIYAMVLKVDRVGATDDFFELGGHSLLAAQLISRVRDAFGVELPMRALFEAPTVAGLAERVKASSRPVAPPIAAIPRMRGRRG